MSENRSLGPDAVAGFLAAVSIRESGLKQRLRNETRALGAAGRMILGPAQGALLAFLVRLTGARRVLEIGTFTGYSTLCMAEALPPEGRILACDVSAEWTAIGRSYWQEAGLSHRIDLRLQPALDTLAELQAGGEGPFDMAFIDADKTNYPAYLTASLALLRSGGLCVVDNILWGGAVADPHVADAETEAIRRTLRIAAEDAALDHTVLTVGDGLLLVRKP
ncbi:MAG: class I SAM-dependent methyltransferase [Sneathiellaceae bacterium]